MPTAHPALAGKELIDLEAKHFGTEAKYTMHSKFLMQTGGLFSTLLRELNEMLYQNDSGYIFNSSKIEKTFGIAYIVRRRYKSNCRKLPAIISFTIVHTCNR